MTSLAVWLLAAVLGLLLAVGIGVLILRRSR